MAFFKKLFVKNDTSKAPRGFNALTISAIEKLSEDTVKITFDVPAEKKSDYKFAVSTWFNRVANEGDEIFVSQPQGNFTLPADARNCVAIAAGSGITPILAIAKEMNRLGNSLKLFYGNRTVSSVLFRSEIDILSNVKTTYYLSGESHEEYEKGRIDKENFSSLIKSDLSLLKADYFFVCGPEQLIADVVEVLTTFGVDESRIKYELFTVPVILKKEEKIVAASFEGSSEVTIILDDEQVFFDLNSDGDSILEKSIKEGVDAPYSCKGGVCSSCKGKILKGSARMTMNYALTDKEIEDGYVLTCQAHPASRELIISYDDV